MTLEWRGGGEKVPFTVKNSVMLSLHSPSEKSRSCILMQGLSSFSKTRLVLCIILACKCQDFSRQDLSCVILACKSQDFLRQDLSCVILTCKCQEFSRQDLPCVILTCKCQEFSRQDLSCVILICKSQDFLRQDLPCVTLTGNCVLVKGLVRNCT